jgi:excisionase family DNA binding protein
MTEELFSVKEVAAYLNLNEKKIYSLIKRGDIPCTKITGKWLFPKKRIDEWIEMSVGPDFRADSPGNIRIAGSNDPALELLASSVRKRFPRLTVLAANVGSRRGLAMLQRGGTHISGMHIFDPATSEYNIPYLRRMAPSLRPVVVNFAYRDQGILVATGNPLGISGIEDLSRPGVRYINRQPGAGTRLLLDYNLGRLNIGMDKIRGYDYYVNTHYEVAAAIQRGRADAGLGIRDAAAGFGLGFIPVTRERFDLVIPENFFYTEPIQQCLEVTRSQEFRESVAHLDGYYAGDTGTVLCWG